MNTKQLFMMGTMFVAGMAIVGGSFAFRGNGLSEEVTTAIETSDYGTFVNVAPERLLEKIDSEEVFNDMIELRSAKQEIKEEIEAAILAAVQANDYEAFQSIHEQTKQRMEALRPADAPEGKGQELTPEQEAKFVEKKKERFTKLVEYYNENGELPEHKGKWFGMFGKRGGHHGDCGGKGPRGEKLEIGEIE